MRRPALLLVAAVLLAAGCRHPPEPERWNVLWITIDALRADHVGFYGYPKPTSPFLDELGASSTVFLRAYSQESYTQASVPSFFTSKLPYELGTLYDHPTIDVLDPSFLTVAEMLSASGYATAAFVFNPHLRAVYGFDQGFDVYDDHDRWSRKEPRHEAMETAKKMYRKVDAHLRQEARRPIFLYLHYRDVHSPYVPPPPYDRLFWDGPEPAEGDAAARDARRLSLYDGEIRYTDDWLRKTFAMLELRGLRADNTLLIVTADHGEEFYDRHPGDPGGLYHGRTLYREQVHVPLVLRIPGKAPRSVRAPVALLDVVPTVLESLGIEAERFGKLRGSSLMPLVEGEKPHRRLLYAGGNHRRGTLVQGRWKYHRYHRGQRARSWRDTFKHAPDDFVYDFAEELYDLRADPHETRNLAAKHPAVVADLRRKLDRLETELAGSAKRRSVELDDETRKQLEALGYL